MPPVNDDFADAIELVGASGTTGIDTVGATYEAGEPANDFGADGGVSVWFKIVLGTSSTGLGWDISVDTDSTPEMWDSTLEAFTGPDVTSLTIIGGSDDIDYPTNVHSLMEFSAADGDTVYIRVDGWGFYTGYTIGPEISDGVLRWSLSETLPIPALSSTAAVEPHTGDPSPSTNLVEGDWYRITGTDLDYVTRVTLGGRTCTFVIEDSTHLRFKAALGVGSHTPSLAIENAHGDGSSTSRTLWFTDGWHQGDDVWSDDVRSGSPNTDGYGIGYPTRIYETDTTIPDPVGSGTPGAFGGANWSGEWAASGTPTDTYAYLMLIRTIGVDIEWLAANSADFVFPYVYIAPIDYPAGASYASYESDGGAPVATNSIKFQRLVRVITQMERESLNGGSFTYADIVAGGHDDVFAQDFHELLVPASMIARDPVTTRIHLDPDVWPDLTALDVIRTHPALPVGESPNVESYPVADYDYYTGTLEDLFDYADHPRIAFIVVNEHHTGGAQLIAPPADGPSTLDNYAQKLAQSDFYVSEGIGQGAGNILVLYTPPRHRFLYEVPQQQGMGWVVGSATMN